VGRSAAEASRRDLFRAGNQGRSGAARIAQFEPIRCRRE
jgi:hypothetical protein